MTLSVNEDSCSIRGQKSNVILYLYIFRKGVVVGQSKDFWPTIKPFLSQKSTQKSDEPILLKDSEENLISDQNKVVENLNTFYINIAQNIGINAKTQNDETHPSIQKINPNMDF